MSAVKILLAEDNRQHQHLLLRALAAGRPQVNVTVVDCGAEFLRAVKMRRFDCAILDYNLPDYRADELLAAAQGDLRGCPVLVISSNRDQRVVVSVIRQGGVDFVPKESAVRGDELWSRVDHALEQRRLMRRERRQSERRQRHLAKLAETDPLTGLFNRRYLERQLQERRWIHDRRRSLVCAMLDLDHFKRINDQFGHTVGDAVLQAVAQRVRASVGQADVAIRWGGEEFCVLKSSATLLDGWLWAEALRRDVESMIVEAGGARVHTSVSVGLSVCSADQFGLQSLDRADEALYLAKRNRNEVCTAHMTDLAAALRVATSDDGRGVTVTQRRDRFLAAVRPLLGPTQREHVEDHCRKVSEAAGRIAAAMGLEADQVQRIELAGLLHDIGKCAIPEELLAKPRVLLLDEWRLMARHDALGAWIARELGADDLTVSDVRHHHRRYDSEQLEDSPPDACDPTGARVLCVADAWVTMRTDRPYRTGHSPASATHELRRQSGKQFAPPVIDAAVSLTPRQPEALAA